MEIPCPKWCGRCCVVIPFPRELFERNQDKIVKPVHLIESENGDEVYPITDDLKCAFLNPENRCMIYEDRPQVCRDFGLLPNLKCWLFDDTGKKRSIMERKKVKREIIKGKKNLVRLLHERIGKKRFE